jgi:UDP-2,4-diacetamido-2,4,6-trideoxy-beta-L-altropyranose hydrolase
MRIIFRVDASLKMGSGHVMRCLALAEQLKTMKSVIEFICREHDGHLIKKIQNSGFKVRSLQNKLNSKCDTRLFHSDWLSVTQEKDSDDCINALGVDEFDWLIVDHYSLDEEWEKKLKRYCSKILVIDDLADRKHSCDILIDQTYGRKKDSYKALVPSKCIILVGSKYALLRNEFKKNRNNAITKRKSNFILQNILISLGGMDPQNLSGKILYELTKVNWKTNLKINLISGVESNHKEYLEKFRNSMPKNLKVEIFQNVSNISELMIIADIAIGAGGGTNLERCCLGLPSFVLITSENQKESSLNLQRAGAIFVKEDYKSIVNEISKLHSENHININNISNNALNICDGYGIQRVAGIMTS